MAADPAADALRDEPQLSPGAVSILYQCDTFPTAGVDSEPLRLQVIQRHKTKGESQVYYGLTLSDGAYFLYILLTPSLNNLVAEGKFVKYSVIALTSFVVKRAVLQDGKQYRWFESLGVELVAPTCAHVIGIPVPFEETMQPRNGSAPLEKHYGRNVTATMQSIRSTINDWNKYFVEHGELPKPFESDGTSAFLEFKRLFVECTPFFMELSNALESNTRDPQIHKFLEHCTQVSQEASAGQETESARKAEVLGYLRAVRAHILRASQEAAEAPAGAAPEEDGDSNLIFVEDEDDEEEDDDDNDDDDLDPVDSILTHKLVSDVINKLLEPMPSSPEGAAAAGMVGFPNTIANSTSITTINGFAAITDMAEPVVVESHSHGRVQVLQIIDLHEDSAADLAPLFLLVISDGTESSCVVLDDSANTLVEENKLTEGCVIELDTIDVRRDREMEVPWFECDTCRKWRKLKDTEAEQIGEDFVCSMNRDPEYNSCDIKAEMTRQELELLSNQVDQIMMDLVPTVVVSGNILVLSPGLQDMIGNPTECEELIESQVEKWKERNFDKPVVVFHRPVTYASTVPPPPAAADPNAECACCGPVLVTVVMKKTAKVKALRDAPKEHDITTEAKWTLGKLFNSHAKAYNLAASSLHYFFKGKRVHAHQTAEQIGMKSGDVLVAELTKDVQFVNQRSEEDEAKLAQQIAERQAALLEELENEEKQKAAKKEKARTKRKKKKDKKKGTNANGNDDDEDDDDEAGEAELKDKESGGAVPAAAAAAPAPAPVVAPTPIPAPVPAAAPAVANGKGAKSAPAGKAAPASAAATSATVNKKAPAAAPEVPAVTTSTVDTVKKDAVASKASAKAAPAVATAVASAAAATEGKASKSKEAPAAAPTPAEATKAGKQAKQAPAAAPAVAPAPAPAPATNPPAEGKPSTKTNGPVVANGPLPDAQTNGKHSHGKQPTAAPAPGGGDGGKKTEKKAEAKAVPEKTAAELASELAAALRERDALNEELQTRIVLAKSKENYQSALEKTSAALRQQVATLQTAASCTLCRGRARDALVMPCRHLVACLDCVAMHRARVADGCPLCGGHVAGIIEVVIPELIPQ